MIKIITISIIGCKVTNQRTETSIAFNTQYVGKNSDPFKMKVYNIVENRDLKKENMNKNKNKIQDHIFNIRQMECKVKALRVTMRDITYQDKEQSIKKIL